MLRCDGFFFSKWTTHATGWVLWGCVLAGPVGNAVADGPAVKPLLVGSTPSINTGGSEKKEKLAAELLEKFIRDETGMKTEIHPQKDWRSLADKLTGGDLQVGVFQGFEFAWAQDTHAELKPLTLAVNVHRYTIVHVVVCKECAAKAFADIKGQALAMSTGSIGATRKFLERESLAQGVAPDKFFAKIAAPKTIEEALDEVAAGTVQATVVENAALEAYQRRKPGRADKLRILASSDAVLPGILAYAEGKLDKATLKRFRDGLLSAHAKERGLTLLTMFRLTGFEDVPDDFDKIARNTRKTFPRDGE